MVGLHDDKNNIYYIGRYYDVDLTITIYRLLIQLIFCGAYCR